MKIPRVEVVRARHLIARSPWEVQTKSFGENQGFPVAWLESGLICGVFRVFMLCCKFHKRKCPISELGFMERTLLDSAERFCGVCRRVE